MQLIKLLHALCCASLLLLLIETITANEDLGKSNVTSSSDVVEMIFKNAFPKDYDPEISPFNVSVNAAILFLSVPSIQFSRMEIEVEFQLKYHWIDERLIFDKEAGKYLIEQEDVFFRVPDSVKKRLWAPGLTITDCRSCKNTFVTDVPSRELYFITDTNTHTLQTDFRDTMAFACQFDLSFYPFDIHECSIDLRLDDLKSQQTLDYTSGDFAIGERFIVSRMPAQFEFDSLFIKRGCPQTDFSDISFDASDCLQYGISFHRRSAYYVVFFYTPSFIIVVISWITFWLPSNAAAPRITLGMTSLLTLTAQFSAAQKDVPPVAFIKALDVWMLVCVIMVFGSLLEFALAQNTNVEHSGIKTVMKRKELKYPTPTYTAKKVKVSGSIKKIAARQATIKQSQANFLDVKARVVFPIVFALFNVIYWVYYGRGG